MFGTPNAPVMRITPLELASFSVTRIDRTVAEGEVAEIFIPPADAYFLMLYLDHARHADIRADGISEAVCDYPPGTICLVDLSGGAAVALHSNLHSLAFRLPSLLFEEVSRLSDASASRRLRCTRHQCDAVISNLGMALVPMFSHPEAVAGAVLQHIAVAVCEHLLSSYGDEVAAPRTAAMADALSVQQQRVAETFMRDNLASDLPMAVVAKATGLSPGHFSQLFKAAMGVTPHQWLIHTRLERAKDMMADPSCSIRTIALECGFFDRSHFSKAFARHTGLSPVEWRRMRHH